MMRPHDNLDQILEALSNQHRRAIIYALSIQPHSISQLATMRELSLPAIHKHIRVLEEADMIIRKKSGRSNFLGINRASLRGLQTWVNRFHTYWGSDEASLDNYVEYLNRETEEEKETI